MSLSDGELAQPAPAHRQPLRAIADARQQRLLLHQCESKQRHPRLPPPAARARGQQHPQVSERSQPVKRCCRAVMAVTSGTRALDRVIELRACSPTDTVGSRCGRQLVVASAPRLQYARVHQGFHRHMQRAGEVAHAHLVR